MPHDPKRLFAVVLLLILAAVVWCMILAPSSCAQDRPLPGAPKPKPSSKVFWLGSAALAAAKTYDAVRTRQALDRGNWENDPVFGRHPSPAKQAGINAAFFVGEALLFPPDRA